MPDFFFPKLDRRFFLRLSLTALAAFGLFGFVLMPCFINGASMEPAYPATGFNFCNKIKYLCRSPKVGDVVVIKYVGKKYFLKRVVALANDTVKIVNGVLFVNGKKIDEPYLKNGKSDWNLPERRVNPGYIYVIGDNRTMPMARHQFGEVSLKRITGAPLW